MQEQPQFVMVAVDHPNRKVRNLPRILIQAFPVCVISYAEESVAASLNLLNTYASEYVCYPPVTGPAVERTVNKYMKDLQVRAANPQSSRAAINAAQNGVIAIKGDGTNSPMNAQTLLARLLNEDLGMAAQGIGAGQQHSYNGQSVPQWGPIEHDSKTSKKMRYTPEQIENLPMATKKDSIIVRGTTSALRKSCNFTEFEEAQKIEESTNVACITIGITSLFWILGHSDGKR